MLLFDIGATLFVVGLFNFLYFGFAPRFKKADKNGRLGMMALFFIVMVAGPILMMVSHYLVEGFESVI